MIPDNAPRLLTNDCDSLILSEFLLLPVCARVLSPTPSLSF